jgi:hypothetical protein
MSLGLDDGFTDSELGFQGRAGVVQNLRVVRFNLSLEVLRTRRGDRTLYAPNAVLGCADEEEERDGGCRGGDSSSRAGHNASL